MTTNLSQLSPTAVWQWFDQICAIPHPTFHEHALVTLLFKTVQTCGQPYGLTVQDEKAIFLSIKPASVKLDSIMAKPSCGIQTHFDMVVQRGNHQP